MKKLLLFTFIVIGFNFTYAQVCTGSLGDPTVEINFGTGAGIGPSLATGVTTYNYKNADCPIDGDYTIANRIPDCFSNSWHQFNQDHTGNQNGYMMVVNAANEAGVFYTFSVDNLCPKTSYELGAYILNLSKPNTCGNNPIRPNITFKIETETGMLLKEFNTSAIPPSNTPEWKKFAFFFATPNGVSKIILKMINNSSGGCGNDLAIDDITFRPCGPTILAGSSANGNSQTVFNLCEGASAAYNFEASVSIGYQDPAFQWQVDLNDGNGWTDIANSNTTQLNVNISNAALQGYQYRMAAAERDNIQSQRCRVFSNPIKIEISPPLAVDAGSPIFILEGGQAQLNPVAPDGLIYKWTPSTYLNDADSKQPIVKASESITYTLTVADPVTGCTASDEVTVTVDEDLKVNDSFSPNGDGVNDAWAIQGLLGNTDTDISVYNRNGQLIYYSKGYSKEWDGKLKGKDLPMGMYYYIIDTHSSVRPVYKGSLMIIR